MTEINPINNANIIARKLDAHDGKVDGKISASVWNEFACEMDGKVVKKDITLKKALKYIMAYCSTQAKALNKSASEIADNWIAKYSPDNSGYFKYTEYLPEITVPKSLDELPFRNGCCYDARGYDISNLKLTKEQLLNLQIDKTTVMSAEQKATLAPYVESAKDPGLGVRKLHEQGITGKGVRMAIIDQPLGRHEEYSSNVTDIHNVNTDSVPSGWSQASMHGAAVSSIAVGKSVGVAPDAEVSYYAAVNLNYDPEYIAKYKANVEAEIKRNKDNPEYVKFLKETLDGIDKFGAASSCKPYADAINKIVDENAKLPKEKQVSVISISWGFDVLAPDFDEYQQALKRAKEQGVFVVSTRLDDDYTYKNKDGVEMPMRNLGANRNLQKDLDKAEAYEAGAFWKNSSESDSLSQDEKDNTLLVPMDHRTVADYADGTSYRFEGNNGGMSWAVPWLSGMYALAKQTNPNITPEAFWQYAMESSDECKNNDSNQYVGRIINPQKLIENIQNDME